MYCRVSGNLRDQDTFLNPFGLNFRGTLASIKDCSMLMARRHEASRTFRGKGQFFISKGTFLRCRSLVE